MPQRKTRREFLKSMAVAAASASVLAPISARRSLAQGRAGASAPPNVLLIMTDDQGWGDIRSHGNALINTPVADRLASEGARFERFFVSPVCAPTRASLLTGRYHLRTGTHGVTRGYETMRSEESTVAEALKQAGYATGCFGKWHNGAHYPHHPKGQGFDEFLGFCAGHWNNYFDTTLDHNGTPVKTKGFISDVLTDAACQFIKANRHRPFFCYVPYNAPHGPFQVPDKYFDKYKAHGLEDKLACIYGMCENLDDNMGRLLRCLDEWKLRDNTIVLFLTDNGPNSDRFNGGMKGRKGSVDEGGVRVPLFVRWPGRIEPGTQIPQISAHVDLFATILALCAVPVPATLPQDGISLAPLLKGDARDWPDRRLFTFRSPGGNAENMLGAVRTQRWRAVKGRRGWRLYDMIADPGQTRDLAEAEPETLASLRQAYEEKVREVTKAGFDSIPTHVGYRDWPVVTLPGHEAFLEPRPRQGISYRGASGWANDWITNWTDTQSYAWWPLKVVEPGRFEVAVLYTCAKEHLGTRLRVDVAGQSAEATVDKAHDPEPIPSPDRVPRGEVYEKVWAELKVGTLALAPTTTRLVLRAREIPTGQACDIKGVRLRRIA
ncbi:MAG: arylsulfatase [Phycisphaerales bacterium]|nr:MAG: arylsulfatase [Phycisphaerales bacterium]